MVKSILSVSHAGLRDWVIQRLSAIYMALYTIVAIVYVATSSPLSFEGWHALFACIGVKIATIILLMSLLWHAWIGVWTIVTDYVHPAVLRAVIHVLVGLSLTVYLIWGVIIVGGC
jgi:succinate dehydrogenase / fumarate reductase membrane anchor subunit